MTASARAKVDLTIYEGATFNQTFQWKTGDPAVPVDLTGHTADMHIRADIADEEALFDLDTENGGVVIETPNADGKYTVHIDAEDTEGLCPDHEIITAVYDLFLISGGERMLQQYGKVKIYPSVTRPE